MCFSPLWVLCGNHSVHSSWLISTQPCGLVAYVFISSNSVKIYGDLWNSFWHNSLLSELCFAVSTHLRYLELCPCLFLHLSQIVGLCVAAPSLLRSLKYASRQRAVVILVLNPLVFFFSNIKVTVACNSMSESNGFIYFVQFFVCFLVGC